MIPFLLETQGDVTGLAQTGTGKTAAFGLPILQHINPASRSTQALIITPTRELGMQVSREITDYGRNISKLKTATVYGGAPFGPQIADLRVGAHIVTGTPGRLKDLLNRGILNLNSLNFLVLDEADQMLDMGFKDDLDSILEAANPQRRTLLFSATMPEALVHIAARYMKQPRTILAGKRNEGAVNVSHFAFRIHAGDKYAALRRLIDVRSRIYGIVFCRTRHTASDLAAKLSRDGYAADALHGELSQNMRESVMRRFREGNPSLLVATDVAARGLDVDNLTHVIHYDLPEDVAVYTHRSGRTGRAGKRGCSLALVHLKEGMRIKRIERSLGRPIETGLIPGGKQVCQSRLINLIKRVTEVDVDDEAVKPYLHKVQDILEPFDREELLMRFISVEFNRFLKEYGNAPDLNPSPVPKNRKQDFDKPSGRNGRRSSKMSSLRVNLGKKHSVLPPQLIGLINKATASGDIRLGRIDIGSTWTEFQVEAGMAARVKKALQGYEYRGRKIQVEPKDGRKPGKKKRRK